MKVYSIYILNKAGGLIYQLDVNQGLAKLSANDYLVLAGTLHGVHAIASKLSSSFKPTDASGLKTSGNNSSLLQSGKFQSSNNNKTGLQSIETELFNLYVFQSLTGIKFIIVTTSNPAVHMDEMSSKGELTRQFELVHEIYRKLYVLYGDYVMKDPFYSLDMPIKSTLFEQGIKNLIQ
ncbi:trafficking protein particle complex subunit 23 [Diutina catenulata]